MTSHPKSYNSSSSSSGAELGTSPFVYPNYRFGASTGTSPNSISPGTAAELQAKADHDEGDGAIGFQGVSPILPPLPKAAPAVDPAAVSDSPGKPQTLADVRKKAVQDAESKRDEANLRRFRVRPNAQIAA
eukprot:GHVT01017993.1.p2 GENE.GHVT01017993.1~~GHVT01017993.1.p2  ORF type:complete len:131 (+),score=24.54 GHVT01017993.1:757-1149(+)